MDRQAIPDRIGSREVDVFEGAASLLFLRLDRLMGAGKLALQHHDLARVDLADVVATEGLQRAGLGPSAAASMRAMTSESDDD